MKETKQTKVVPHATPPKPDESRWEDLSCRLGALGIPFALTAWFIYCVFFGPMLQRMNLNYLMMALFLGLLGIFPVIFGMLALKQTPKSRKARIGLTLGVIMLIGSLVCGAMFVLNFTS